MECRINAEDPERFRPSPGKLETYHPPGGPGVRLDTHAYEDYVIPPFYDSLVAKLIAADHDRAATIKRMGRALEQFVIEGIQTTIPLHQEILQDRAFRAGDMSTKFMERFLEERAARRAARRRRRPPNDAREPTPRICPGRAHRAQPPGAVYAIADVDALGGDRARVEDAVAAMARGGAGWVQLRAKQLADRELLDLALACRRALDGTGAAFWIDDRPDVAALCGAAGVHLGQADLPPEAARRVLGPEIRIGRSTHDREQILEAAADPAVDVIAVGPVYGTRSKERPDPAVGLELVRWARTATDKPLVAIGGIDGETIAQVLAAGADAAAVISAVCRGTVEENVRRLRTAAESAAPESGSRGRR